MSKQTILAAAVAGWVLAVAPAALAMEFVSIGDPKNPDDKTPRGPYGGVPYEYRIGKHEVMIAEWKKAGLGSGNEDEWEELVGPGAPASNVSWHEAAQFANWMTAKYGGGNPYYKDDGSGKMSIPTEGENPISHYDWAVTKGKGTTYFVPTEDEWYKAAYYDPDKGDRGGYWSFPTAGKRGQAHLLTRSLWFSSIGEEKEMGKKKVAKKVPQKQCPKCGAMVHVRKAACDCGHKFKAAAKNTAAPKKTKPAKATPTVAKAPSLEAALKAERKNLQQRLAKIDDLLDTYQ